MDTLSPEKRYCKVRKRKTKHCLDKLRKKSKTDNKKSIPFEVKQKPKISIKETGKGNKISINNNLTNITKNRMTIKHGFFAKGARSATYSRMGLSEEYKARSEGNLNKIIDLANGEPENISLPSEKVCNIKEKLTLFKDERSHDNYLSFSLTKKRKDEHPSIQIINVNSQPSIFKSPPQNINLRNTTVGHISPIKFSTESKMKKSSLRSQLGVAVLKTKPKPSETCIKILGDYGKIYEEFTEHVNNGFKKYLPTKIVDTTVNLRRYLKAVYLGCNSRSSNQSSASKGDRCHSNFSQNFSPQEPRNINNTPENIALLNPIEYLMKVSGNNNKSNCTTTLRENVCHFRDSLQSVYDCGASNSKYIEMSNHCRINSGLNNNKHLNTTTWCSPEVVYSRTGKSAMQEADRENYSMNIFSDSSLEELMNRSYENQNDDMFAIHVIDDTPEPRFYSRQMN